MNKQKLKELIGRQPPPGAPKHLVGTRLTRDGKMLLDRSAIGMTLTWFVQCHGLWEQKEGMVCNIILANDGEVYDGLISEGIKPGYIKFKRTSRRDRVLMEVRRYRSNKAKLPSYWYAPLLSNNFYYKPE